MWAWFVSTRAGRWIVGVAALIASVAGIALAAFLKGRRTQADADKAKDAQSLAEAAQKAVNAANVRKDVDNDTAKLPDAPAQSVANADPATAAGKLQNWTRD